MDNIKGFFKVAEDCGGVTVAVFFNPKTKESFSKIVWDIDNDELLYDNEIQMLRFMPINDEVRKIWLKHKGVISIGDTVEVYKGKKVKVGTIAVVQKIIPWKDCYGRTRTIYAYLSTGERTNIENCRLK